MFLFWIVLLLFFPSCAPHSSLEFQKEGEKLCLELVEILQEVDSREMLLKKEKSLQKKFCALVSVMIEARTWQENHPEADELEGIELVNLASDPLKKELCRIYELEEGREIVERAELEALVRLDAYERGRLKRRERIR